MKIAVNVSEFVSASSKDLASRVTMKTPTGLNLKRGQEVKVSFKYEGVDYKLLFYVNRDDGSTLKTMSWSHGLPELKPGVKFSVGQTEIEVI